ncbi:MAG TPA: energy transducer TonB [Burkholderiaceae bacterium]|nr:energy transducer TonB [Burkholderiaceae bacterium]
MANAAPDVEAAPGAANIAGEADYLSRLKAWLEQHKAYPRRARLQAIEGEVMIAITFDRSGRVLAQQLIASSGHASLDRAALAAVESANPLPAIPPELPHQQMTLNVPFGFHLM